MATIPDDIKSGLQNLCKAKKMEIKNLVAELKQIMEQDDTIKAMPTEHAEFKIRYAFALLCRRYTSTSQKNDMYLKLFSFPRLGKTKAGKARTDISAMVKRITQDENENDIVGDIEIGAGTLWEKAAEAASKLSPEKVYKVSLTTREVKTQVNESTFEGLELSGNDALFVEAKDIEFPSNEQFYKEFIEPMEDNLLIELDEVDLNSKNNRVDFRVIKCRIIDNPVGTRTDGTEYGNYKVTDDSLLGGGDSGKPGNITLWLNPREVIYEKGVTIKLIVAISYNEATKRTNFDYFFNIPIGVVVKKLEEIKPVPEQKETVDIDLDTTTEENEESIKGMSESDDDFAI